MYRKSFAIICLFFTFSIYGKRYAPYPILFVHGAGSQASAALPLFGVNENALRDAPFSKSLGSYFSSVNPKYYRWKFYPEIKDTAFSDKYWNQMQCFYPTLPDSFDTLGPYLHAFSFKEPRASIDPDPENGYDIKRVIHLTFSFKGGKHG